MWQTNQVQSFNASNFRLLLDNQIPAIRIPKFGRPSQFLPIKKAIDQFESRIDNPHIPDSKRLGVSYFECLTKGKAYYFEQAHRDTQKQEHFFTHFNPIVQFSEWVHSQTPFQIELAYEEAYGAYFAGRSLKGASGLVHYDFNPHLARKDWKVGQVKNQISLIFYLSMPKTGGEVQIYDKIYQLGDETQICTPGYNLYSGGYYSDSIVENTNLITIQPNAGDIVLFNVRNYHKVVPSPQERHTLGYWLGEIEPNQLIYWS